MNGLTVKSFDFYKWRGNKPAGRATHYEACFFDTAYGDDIVTFYRGKRAVRVSVARLMPSSPRFPKLYHVDKYNVEFPNGVGGLTAAFDDLSQQYAVAEFIDAIFEIYKSYVWHKGEKA